MFVPNASVPQEIEDAVRRTAKELAGTVLRIRYDFGEDWTGDPSLFFRVVLKDEAIKGGRLAPIAKRVELMLTREVRPEERRLHAYFNFRRESEQAELKEPSWA